MGSEILLNIFRSERTARMAENADKHKEAEASKQKR